MADFIGVQYTVTATATTLTDALGITEGWEARQFQQVDFWNLSGNDSVFLGPSTVTAAPANAYARIVANGGYTIGPFALGVINADKVYIVGTAGNVINIAAFTA